MRLCGQTLRESLSLILLVCALLLSGCAALNEKECRANNWQELGLKDGKGGLIDADRLGRYTEACKGYGIAPDRALYSQGYQRGLVSFCTELTGFKHGLSLRQHFAEQICPMPGRQAFLDGYRQAEPYGRTAAEVTRLEQELSSARSQRDAAREKARNEKADKYKKSAEDAASYYETHVFSVERSLYSASARLSGMTPHYRALQARLEQAEQEMLAEVGPDPARRCMGTWKIPPRKSLVEQIKAPQSLGLGLPGEQTVIAADVFSNSFTLPTRNPRVLLADTFLARDIRTAYVDLLAEAMTARGLGKPAQMNEAPDTDWIISTHAVPARKRTLVLLTRWQLDDQREELVLSTQSFVYPDNKETAAALARLSDTSAPPVLPAKGVIRQEKLEIRSRISEGFGIVGKICVLDDARRGKSREQVMEALRVSTRLLATCASTETSCLSALGPATKLQGSVRQYDASVEREEDRTLVSFGGEPS